MTGTYAAAHVKFAKLRKRLDQLGYKQPLGLDSLPLVERLFYDLVWTTENLRKAKTELSSQIQIRSTVEDYIAPYKTDNGRLIRENNEINRHLMILRQDYEENIRGLKGECRRLENTNEDMKYFNSQCLDKIHSYEKEAKRMVEQILYLQEKNFQAVVYTPDGGKKQLPFRRQRMDIDSLAPLSIEAKTLNNENYCCSIARMWEKDNMEYSPKMYNLLEITTKHCEELENQMHNLEEELELNEKKVENFRQQVILRDSEIERLRSISERGRPLEAVLNDSTEKQTDRLIHQLQIQTDLLQTRNAELESRIVDLVNREVPDMQSSITLVNNECQTVPTPELVLVNNSSQTNSVNATIYEYDSNSDAAFRALQSELLGLQTERDYYRDELEKMKNEFHQLYTSSNKCSDNDDNICSVDEMKCLHQERNDLISLLDHFERQLHDIQGNVRVLTHERDILLQQLSQTEKQQVEELEQNNKTSCDPIFSNQHVISHSYSSVQNLDNTVDVEHDETIKKLHLLTAERDSLHERLHTLTIEYNDEKAHLIHCLENNKSELNDIKETKGLLEQRVTELIKSCIDKQSECDRLIEKVNCLEKHQSNNDHILFIEQNLQVVQAQLDKVQKDYEKCRNECTSLHVTLRQIDQEKDHLQTCLDERTERCIALERQIVTYETSIKELKVTAENSEKRILRLTQSVIERETENHELVERLSKSECDLKSTSKNLELTTKELEKTKNEMNRLKSETQKLQGELTSSYDKQSELDKRVVDFDKEFTNLRNMYTTKEQERINLLKEYTELGLQLDEKVTLVNHLESQLNELNQKYSTQDKESLNLNQQLQHQKKECQDYAQVVQSLEVQCELLKRTISNSEERIKRLQIENEEIRCELTDSRNLCNSLEQHGNSLQHQYTLSNFEVNQLKAKLLETERQLIDLRKQVDHEREAIRNFELILVSSREAENTAQIELKECRAEICSLRERLTTTEVKLLQSESEAKTLQKQLLLVNQKQSQDHYSTSIIVHTPTRYSPIRSNSHAYSPSNRYDENCSENDLIHNLSLNIEELPSPALSIDLLTDNSVKKAISSPVSYLDKLPSSEPAYVQSNTMLSSNSSIFIPIRGEIYDSLPNLSTRNSVHELVASKCKPISPCNNFATLLDMNFSQGDDSGRPVSENTTSNEP
ncbi:hypothetical protein MN116_005769 [Schistosoma mekongi]|uniref:Centrosomal protein of 135 kDa n=1 Tax=Schistosoma mekongi TaxID=38744 RepID=A0AAE1Z9X3_SCHME|nr:hypothetical protein MN116_005769 [Schistosoma mekongi]